MPTGRCHCGAIRYEVTGEMLHHAVCHCEDCRRCAGAAAVPWIAFPADSLAVSQGTPKLYESSNTGRRQFCGDCGTGLFYTNDEFLPGIVDIQSVTFDNPQDFAPQVHIQIADALPWEAQLDALPKFERYPSQS